MKFPLQSLRERCLATLAYFDLFDYPLKLEEIERYFLGELSSREALEHFLASSRTFIHQLDGYYFFPGREHIVITREEREKVSQRYWKKVRSFLPFILLVPFVRMVGVCNTLSFNNASAESDIDLFIVAKAGRLFIVRFFTVLLFALLGVRRHGNKIAGRFCLSFYVDDSALDMSKIQSGSGDIYLPFWVLTMKPIFGRDTYSAFVKANLWIEKYFGHPLSFAVDIRKGNPLRFLGWIKEHLLKGKLGDRLENKLRSIQMKRHKHHLEDLPSGASIVVTDHMLKFHNIDRRHDIAVKFRRRLDDIIASS